MARGWTLHVEWLVWTLNVKFLADARARALLGGRGAVLLHRAIGEGAETALFSAAGRAGGTQRRREDRQQGERRSQEGKSAARPASPWASEGEIARAVPLTHLVRDGHVGNHNALAMARPCHLHLISKLRYDVALDFPYPAPMLDGVPIARMAARSMMTTSHCHTCKRPPCRATSRPAATRRKCFIRSSHTRCNVVIMVKTNLRTQAQAHVILLSSD